ncbi:NAD-dependent succinate-semialdehyde dehydrogenase [Oceanibacterium hippocampi]|uniref:Alpha-ketoglutaric semialdehyde dehydrogenase n=1 Tax=Oceanibacterium hippocampi TaxID=745714 RepID=A0A1Y5TP47_9PROT|nr:NAD-dependent succinate-semialdehyde dehydrogenase [Oceanibacterium hippocampi]SLN66659.1 Alpha-ketoglutaric semialdehyde dehydrogenase [Oceanibacterium hippocampi]
MSEAERLNAVGAPGGTGKAVEDYAELALFINGRFIGSGEGRKSQEVVNPATGETIGRLPHATVADLDEAVRAASAAFADWRRVPAVERGQILRRAAELARERAPSIARGITLDQGKPLAEALGEVNACSEHAVWHAEECKRIYGRLVPARQAGVRQLVEREPIGVVAAFTPWNFPFNQAIRKIAAALGAGCTIVIKGAEETPSALVALARLFQDAGLPDGCLNVVWGVPAEVSEHLIRADAVRKISFTGSVAVGKQLAALSGSLMKRATLELGGHSPAIVCADADIDAAATLLAAQKFRNAGQVCISPSRIYVERAAHDRFMDTFLDRVRGIRVGDGLAPDTTMGPLTHARRVRQMTELVEDAVNRQARVECGGEVLDRPGYFFAPTVVTNIPDSAYLMTLEPFGPIASVTTFTATEEVLTRANSLAYGLAAMGFTSSPKTSQALSQGLQAGMVSINHWGFGAAETPFGGIRDSGWGSEGGIESFDGYLNTKLVSETY